MYGVMKRAALVLAGHGLVGLGVIGVFVPVMPTVGFLVAAAACYARGNPALHRRLLAHPRFGPPLRDWEEHRAMSPRAKITAVAMVTIGIGVSALWLVETIGLRIALAGVGVAIIGFLLSVRTRG